MKAYKFKLTRLYRSKFPYKGDFKNEWIEIKGHGITIKKGYSWDGCTPKLKIYDLGYLGTPDGVMNNDGFPLLYYPSLVHDALYQFKSQVPFTRLQADQLFLTMGKGFRLIKFYYVVIRLFGGFLGKWNK